MLQEDIQTPIIFFALDDIDTSSTDTLGALSVENSTASELEQLSKEQKNLINESSDVYAYLSRVPIPITDRLLPIHYVGGTHQQSHFVDYLNDSVELTKSANVTTLNFEIQNKLSTLSTIADLILGIADKDFYTSKEPRVSFFSSNICIFNAYLRGINRTFVNNTDKEVLSITLENAPNRIEPENKTETTALSNTTSDINVSTVLYGGVSASEFPDASINSIVIFDEVQESEINYAYTWYTLFNNEQISQIEVSDYTTEFTVNRETLRFMRVNSVDISGALRFMITVEYDNTFTTIKPDDGQVNNEKYGLMFYNDYLYLGVLNES